MTRFELTGEPQVTVEPHSLITHERLIVDIESGCLWSAIIWDDKEDGVVFLGETRYTLEAIVETERGAIGQSYKGQMEGYKLYLGSNRLEEVSQPANMRDIKRCGYSDFDDFKEAANHGIIDLLNLRSVNRETCKHSRSDSGVLFWSENGKRNVIVAKAEELVFTRSKHVFVLNKDKVVSVQNGTVLITNGKGEELFINRDGIRSPKALKDLETKISETVEKTLAGLKESFTIRNRQPHDDREQKP